MFSTNDKKIHLAVSKLLYKRKIKKNVNFVLRRNKLINMVISKGTLW